MADLRDALSQQRCLYYRFAKRAPELSPGDVDQNSRLDGDSGGLVTLIALQSVLQDHFKCEHMCLNPTIEMDIRLVHDIADLRLLVPTAVERSAVGVN
jgi:hypothetical protein